MVFTLGSSPTSTLFHSLQKVFAPCLLKESGWGHPPDTKVQGLITQLETGLASVLRKEGGDMFSRDQSSRTDENAEVRLCMCGGWEKDE